MKQTAVDWLVDNLKPIYPNIEEYKLLIGLAKDKEKEQMVLFSVKMSQMDGSNTGIDILEDEAIAHYNKTYLKENK